MTGRCEWRHAPEAWAEIWEKWMNRVLASEEDGWLSELAEDFAAGAARGLGQMEKSS